MTKIVRIENADSGTEFKVVVEVWEKDSMMDRFDPVKVREILLNHPTAMATENLTTTRYFVVREA